MSVIERIGEISVKGDHEVEWKIKGILSHTDEDDNYHYYSPNFTISDSEWCLSVCPNVQIRNNSVGWIGLHLHRIMWKSPKGVHFTVVVKRTDGTVEDTVQFDARWLFDENNQTFGFYKLLQLRNSDLPSSVFTITCTLRVVKSIDFTSRLETLSRNFGDLFISKKGCDAILEVKSKKFPIHRCILSARSPVLAAMFEAEMKQKETRIVSIPDCDPRSFEDFLKYLYSGKVDLSSNALKLFEIAHKYDVRELKSDCVFSIMGTLSLQNVLDAFILGHRSSEIGLKVRAKKFIIKNFSKIVLTEKWKSFMQRECDLANELLKAAIIKQ